VYELVGQSGAMKARERERGENLHKMLIYFSFVTTSSHIYLFLYDTVTIFIDCYFHAIANHKNVYGHVVQATIYAMRYIRLSEIGMKVINQKQFSFILNGVPCVEDISCHRSLFDVIDKQFVSLWLLTL
jgi:hypothetical protein